ncbi:YidC/Oxa1 family membrane protein insertase [Thermoactinospora rubra]|uniref:YidC/Oxa1 family membrane protein insertase n=1 Tax=Thermoactinospora rubra TaxID=1088767 RepID=UPI000A1146D3|nr:membrane protein insertase YidC [Thermoactinospora rubra]
MIDTFVAFITGLTHPALAIVLFTLAVRSLLLPLGIRQARGVKLRERLAPRLKQLQKRYARNPERLRKEVMALYAKEGSSPFAGILPGLAQLPFLWLMYRVATHPTALVGHDLFGAPLGQNVAAVVANFGLISWPFMVFAVLVAAILVVAWLTSRKVKERLPEDQPEMMRRILPLMAYGSAAAALFLPLAAGLYLLVSTAWTYTERLVLY